MTVARFIGSPAINLLPVEIGTDGAISFLGNRLAVVAREGKPGQAMLGLRPEDLSLATEGLAARVRRIERHGADRYVHLDLHEAPDMRMVMRQGAWEGPAPELGSVVTLGFEPGRAHLFGADGERRELAPRERLAA